ncbi:MAG: hypothetical protein WCT32_03140 [Patescibacteria group bacterium]|jgi:hypothetical protein
MRWIKYLLVGVLSLFLVMLDVTYFSSLPIKGATIFSSLVVVIVTALIWPLDPLLILISFLSVLFAIFSSLPIVLILIMFFLLPVALVFCRQRYLPGSSRFVVLVILIVTCLSTEMLMLIFFPEWSSEVATSIGYFVLINSIFGMAVFELATRVRSAVRHNEIRL